MVSTPFQTLRITAPPAFTRSSDSSPEPAGFLEADEECRNAHRFGSEFGDSVDLPAVESDSLAVREAS